MRKRLQKLLSLGVIGALVLSLVFPSNVAFADEVSTETEVVTEETAIEDSNVSEASNEEQTIEDASEVKDDADSNKEIFEEDKKGEESELSEKEDIDKADEAEKKLEEKLEEVNKDENQNVSEAIKETKGKETIEQSEESKEENQDNSEEIKETDDEEVIEQDNELNQDSPEEVLEARYVDGGFATGYSFPLQWNGVKKYTVTQLDKNNSHGSYLCSNCGVKYDENITIDLAAASGTPIYAVESGTVKEAATLSNNGNYVVIKHNDGSMSCYNHMRDTPLVKKGQTVSKGQQIGVVGKTGLATGNHLHFEWSKHDPYCLYYSQGFLNEYTGYGKHTHEPPTLNGPQVIDSYITNINRDNGKFEATVKFTSDKPVYRVQFKIYTTVNGTDDLAIDWKTSSKYNANFASPAGYSISSFWFDVANFNYERTKYSVEACIFCEDGTAIGHYMGEVDLSPVTYSVDVNGYMNGNETPDLENAGIFDVYLNGIRVAEGVNDYYNPSVEKGTHVAIKNIRRKTWYIYEGVYSGSTDYILNGDAKTILAFKYEPIKAGWKQSGNKWWYQNADGSYPKNAWKLIDGKWYYFDNLGYMYTGWLYYEKSWYYLDSAGMSVGWKFLDGNWFYFASNGCMQTGWITDNGKRYFLNSDGTMAKSRWINNSVYLKANGEMAVSEWVDGGKYYVGAEGLWVPGKQKPGWKQDKTGWWYLNEDGTYPRSCLKRIGDKWYIFNASGYMQTGWWMINSYWFFFESSGAMATNKWIQNKYFVKSNGTMAVSEWVDGGKYYVDGNGVWVPGKTR